MRYWLALSPREGPEGLESHEKLAGGGGREGNDEESWWKGEGRGGRPFAPQGFGSPSNAVSLHTWSSISPQVAPAK